jgi:hypothetical protein
MFTPKKNGPLDDNEPLLIEESYSGEPVHEYIIKNIKVFLNKFKNYFYFFSLILIL